MNFYITLFSFILLFALVSTSPVEKSSCSLKADFDQCSDDSECSNGCCIQNICQHWGIQGYVKRCEEAKEVCNKKKCSEGKVCYPQDVACFVAPCPPIFGCVNPANKNQWESLDS